MAERNIRFDEPDVDTTYIGEAAIGITDSQPFWRIRKFSKIGTITKMQWADGDTNFDNIWDDHTTLTYSD